MAEQVAGEGGAHRHRLESSKRTTRDGSHKHLFYYQDRLIMTELDGAHWHTLNTSKNSTDAEPTPAHAHRLLLSTDKGVVEFRTSTSNEHIHELHLGATTVSGLHGHTVEIGKDTYPSLMPGALLEEVAAIAKASPKYRDLNLQKRLKVHEAMTFALMKMLNRADFRSIVRVAVERHIFKDLFRLDAGLQIQALILSKERFSDIGFASRFVMDHGLAVGSSEDRENAFTFQIKPQADFQEATLQRVRLTEGVEAVVGLLREMQTAAVSETTSENQEVTSQTQSNSSTTSDSEQQSISANRLIEMAERFKRLKHSYTSESAKSPPALLPLMTFPICKQDSERRLVTGPVLIPEKTDLQNEIISAEEIEQAAHNYLVKLTFQSDPAFLKSLGLSDRAERGFMHVEFDRRIAVVESYLAPIDFSIGSRKVVKGTWILTVKVFDDEVWNLVKVGRITGFSIGGRARLIDETSKKSLDLIFSPISSEPPKEAA